jgi:hypothetical protein
VKIILSRKGFDSSVGGYPSPILPDGPMLSLPIPSSLDSLSYYELPAPGGRTYGQIMDQLGANGRTSAKGAHLDPDLVAGTRRRGLGWRPSLGQIGSAAGHLRNQDVGVGDLFLFYGWFRQTIQTEVSLQYSRAPGVHAIFGYMEVGEVLAAHGSAPLPLWLADHPHALPARRTTSTNTIYVSAERALQCDDQPGAGVFVFCDALVLTKPGHPRGRWGLDASVFQHLSISYHDQGSWRDGYFQSYPRAQEYVIHADRGAIDWARDLICNSARWA